MTVPKSHIKSNGLKSMRKSKSRMIEIRRKVWKKHEHKLDTIIDKICKLVYIKVFRS